MEDQQKSETTDGAQQKSESTDGAEPATVNSAVDTTSAVANFASTVCDTTSTDVDTTSTVEDATPTVTESTTVEGETSSVGTEIETPVADTTSTAVVTESSGGITTSTTTDATSNVAETSSTNEPASSAADTVSILTTAKPETSKEDTTSAASETSLNKAGNAAVGEDTSFSVEETTPSAEEATPVAETTSVESPVAETTSVESPVAETTSVESPVAETASVESTSDVAFDSYIAQDSASTEADTKSTGADEHVSETPQSDMVSDEKFKEKTEDMKENENSEELVKEIEDLTKKETEQVKSVNETSETLLSEDKASSNESDKAVTVEKGISDEKYSVIEEKDSLSEIPLSETITSAVRREKEQTDAPQKDQSYEDEFQKFLSHPTGEPPASDNESCSNDVKGEVAHESELKTTTEDFKKFNAICSEETSNSSWYKMQENKEEPMDVAESGLLGDENSNMSVPENASVVSSNIGDNSCQSFPVDEGSNLSIPDDGSSVPAFSGHQPVFDESANMNPPSNVTFAQPDTPSSVNADTTSESTPTSKRNRRGTLQLAAEEANEQGHNITAADIYEYQWPQENDADWFILQEQVSVYLDVKSFKRKYPEIFRRVCDKLEKDFLREKGVVTETQSDLGLTALKSEDVHDLMSRDYPAKYKEFLKILHDREKKRIAEKMREYDAPRLEKEKMIEYTKSAMKSASDWNRKMLKERNKERRAYFDMQTFAIHYPKGKFRKVQKTPGVQTSYPISLIPGQFQEYYRKYSPEELKYFPLNTTVFHPPKKLDPIARLQEQIVRRQKQQLALQQTVVVQRNVPVVEPSPAGPGSEVNSDDDSSSGSSSSGSDNESSKKKGDGKTDGKPEDKKIEKLKKKEKSSSRETSKEKSVEPIVIKREPSECRICKDEKDKSKIPVGESLITCSECKRAGHPSCFDLTDEMVKVIKTYPWQCMECKRCVQCMDPYDEDKMLFCDNCDRGYHTFCVGLKSLPTGKWECKSCTGDTTPIIPLPRPTPKSKRGRKPKDPNAQSSTPAKVQKEKDAVSVKPTPGRPRREVRDQDKTNGKDAKEVK